MCVVSSAPTPLKLKFTLQNTLLLLGGIHRYGSSNFTTHTLSILPSSSKHYCDPISKSKCAGETKDTSDLTTLCFRVTGLFQCPQIFSIPVTVTDRHVALY